VIAEKTSLFQMPRDAWKNPKQRELKDVAVLGAHPRLPIRCMEKSQATGIESHPYDSSHRLRSFAMHGKIPSNGN